MSALTFWLTYLALAFVIAPAIFRLRYGRWPYAYSVKRYDAYQWIDFTYGTVAIGLAVCLLFSDSSRSISSPGGLALGVLAVMLMTLAVISMGPSWRIGQSRSDESVQKVTSGLYRYTRHPIYIALMLLATAVFVMLGMRWYTVAFVLITAAYCYIQARNENRRWHSDASTGDVPTPR